MKPGRDLDALVAEKVMGYVPGSCSCMDLCKVAYLKIRPSGAYEMVGCIHKLPNYSTDISAAWELMDKLKGLEPEISWSDEQHCWHCIFWKGRNCGTAKAADTASHAICLAALDAEGVECPDPNSQKKP